MVHRPKPGADTTALIGRNGHAARRGRAKKNVPSRPEVAPVAEPGRDTVAPATGRPLVHARTSPRTQPNGSPIEAELPSADAIVAMSKQAHSKATRVPRGAWSGRLDRGWRWVKGRSLLSPGPPRASRAQRSEQAPPFVQMIRPRSKAAQVPPPDPARTSDTGKPRRPPTPPTAR